jgi:SAM-dependent methyltransferase
VPLASIKIGLKKSLLAVYNPIVHRLRHLAGWAGVFATCRWSACETCGRKGPKRFLQAAVGQELVSMWGLSADEARKLRIKESMICPWCGSKTRGRRLAAALLHILPTEARSVREYANLAGAGSKQILILNVVDGLSESLAGVEGIVQSEFIDGSRPGEIVGGLRHEDAQRLTFDDQSFDVVISSETLEHIPNLDQALGEIGRVLKTGGVHLFTIPLKPGTGVTEKRLQIAEDGSMVDLVKPRLHHPGGSWGWPVVTEFGDDLPEYLADRGWAVEIEMGDDRAMIDSITSAECPVILTFLKN